MIRLLDYLFVLRPTQFFPLWMTMLSGYALASGSTLFSFEPLPILAILLLTLNFGAVFVFNQIVDRENDFHNNKLFLISHNHIPLKLAWIEAIIITLISVVSGYWVSVPFMLCALGFTGVGILYNFIGFMNRPILGAAMNFSGGVIFFISGAYAVQTGAYSFYQLLFFSLPYGFAWAAVYLLVTLPDIEGDRKFGKRTAAVHYGIKPTLTAAFVLDGLALVSSILTFELVIISTVG
ncbi:MAG: UbiA family prenyltransferase, partial [Chlorobiales bacterium]|nr:UbiA family prenyltransferase [Chlorobiales bacterium]